jgi:hypothetical protein
LNFSSSPLEGVALTIAHVKDVKGLKIARRPPIKIRIFVTNGNFEMNARIIGSTELIKAATLAGTSANSGIDSWANNKAGENINIKVNNNNFILTPI